MSKNQKQPTRVDTRKFGKRKMLQLIYELKLATLKSMGQIIQKIGELEAKVDAK